MASTINRGKPLRKVQKDAILEGLRSAEQNLTERLVEIKKQIIQVENHPVEG